MKRRHLAVAVTVTGALVAFVGLATISLLSAAIVAVGIALAAVGLLFDYEVAP